MGVLGIDIGGTNLRVGLVENNDLIRVESMNIRKNGSKEEILGDLISLIDRYSDCSPAGMGIGVPGVVDAEKGIGYDLVNIPSWKEIRLKEILGKKYGVPVYVNNDANCFAVGEKYFGKAKNYSNAVGLIIGTGFGAGLIINNHLYSGANTGAGEFGMIPYKDHNYEYYCCGQFFKNEYNMSGEEAACLANDGNPEALGIYEQFGNHLGNAIKMILFAIDPEVIILGGSVSKSFEHFKNSMWSSINKFEYSHSLDRLKIMVSDINHSAILGAAALYFDAYKSEV